VQTLDVAHGEEPSQAQIIVEGLVAHTRIVIRTTDAVETGIPVGAQTLGQIVLAVIMESLLKVVRFPRTSRRWTK